MTEARPSETREGRPNRRLALIALAIALAAGGFLLLFALRGGEQDSSRFVVEEAAPPIAVRPDPLRAELARCRMLAAGSEDARCRAAWERNRRRFFDDASAAPIMPAPARED